MANKFSLRALYREAKKNGGFPLVYSRPPTAPHRMTQNNHTLPYPINTGFPPISSLASPPHKNPNMPDKS